MTHFAFAMCLIPNPTPVFFKDIFLGNIRTSQIVKGAWLAYDDTETANPRSLAVRICKRTTNGGRAFFQVLGSPVSGCLALDLTTIDNP